METAALTLAHDTDLIIDVRESAPRAVIALDGELDIVGAPRLRQALVDLLNAGAASLEVDLSGLRFIDSTGLGVLVGAHRRLAANGGKLRVSRPQASTYRVLELSGLTRAFDVVEPPTAAS